VLVEADSEGQGDLCWEASRGTTDCVALEHDVDGGTVVAVLQKAPFTAACYATKWADQHVAASCALWSSTGRHPVCHRLNTCHVLV
jgi:hypothetical protein